METFVKLKQNLIHTNWKETKIANILMIKILATFIVPRAVVILFIPYCFLLFLVTLNINVLRKS